MDVEGLNAAVLNPDLKLVNTAVGKTPGSEASLSSSSLSPTAKAPRLLIIQIRKELITASLTPAKVKVISATGQLA